MNESGIEGVDVDGVGGSSPSNQPAWLTVGADFLAPTIGELTASFARWFERQDTGHSLWPPFDRWLRDTLNQFFRARRVRCFRVNESDRRLTSMSGDLDNTFWLGASPPSLVEHVRSCARRYVQGAANNGELIARLAAEWPRAMGSDSSPVVTGPAPVWLLPIRSQGQTIGLLAVGELPEGTLHDAPTLQAVGHLIELYWGHVHLADALETVRRTDQASGVLSRVDLSAMAEQVLHESITEDEPIILLAISVEGIRRLDDAGQWVLRDWLIKRIGLTLRQKVRSDDLVGRFNDDRFVAVLRRLDLSLGRLIAAKLLASARAVVNEQAVLRDTVHLRCGLAEAVSEGLPIVLGRAFDALRQARLQHQDIVVAAMKDAPTPQAMAEVRS